ncbi:class I SAM-dependent methyltransferase [Nitrosococcus wardiae]|uniref:Class I SAM-dependent methyltransferase n=1 Tax=Nitrosococcus wardiae TaxID=1814290 RepID=A0A4V1AVI6_9GAMM|nr:class I SAM-dependent methyltransferase [Nitrosococcus wardiae]QBQ53265.1 class I SAM-dependent methyltransferase [Nitrosococcus wardiae]
MIVDNSCYLESIRSYELNLAMGYMPKGARILEIGAGAGWQAKMLAEHGYWVKAIDVQSSRYLPYTVFPVQFYDGYTIPFANDTFDIVFSSNVLEHIPHLVDFQDEIKRVLKPGGLAVHVIPTSTWRLWTSLTHYIYIVKLIFRALKYSIFKIFTQENFAYMTAKRLPLVRLVCIMLWPHRHGEHGGSLSELYLFSRYGWKRLFKQGGWAIKYTRYTSIFYTGNAIFHHNLSLKVRASLSCILGSSTNIFCLHDTSKIIK